MAMVAAGSASLDDIEMPKEHPTLSERLQQIRCSPKLQSQQSTASILSAVEDTLREQRAKFTPTAYIAALLSILNHCVSTAVATSNKDVVVAVVYLLDLLIPHAPPPLLRSKFGSILACIEPALSHPDAEAPFLRSSIGCLVSVLAVQDSQAWALSATEVGPRRVMVGLLSLAVDHRPKVRKKAQDGLAAVLANPPPPSEYHPAADMCAEFALDTFRRIAVRSEATNNARLSSQSRQYEPDLLHALKLVKTIAIASRGWPTRSLGSFCASILIVARSNSDYHAIAVYDAFDAIFQGMANAESTDMVTSLLDAFSVLRPAPDDFKLLPSWIAVLSRAYSLSGAIDPGRTFELFPDLVSMLSTFLGSSSDVVRAAATECLVTLVPRCIPVSVVLRPSASDLQTLEKLGTTVTEYLAVKHHSSLLEVLRIIGALLDTLRWTSVSILSKAVAIIGELRSNDAFAEKQWADELISKAIRAMGPDSVLEVLPLNLAHFSVGRPGRAWLLPLIRDSVSNTRLAHFRREMLPLAENLYKRILNQSGKETAMQDKIFETLFQQIWAALPGYCDRPLDVSDAFDQQFAEQVSKILYEHSELRSSICKALQNLVESFKAILTRTTDEDLVAQGRISKAHAQQSIAHLDSFASNLLAVLFNVYIETVPEKRAQILTCIDSYLSITSPHDILTTFERLVTMLDTSMKESIAAGTEYTSSGAKKEALMLPPLSHALMDILVAISAYLPPERFASLFHIVHLIISQRREPQLQKKAYRVLTRLMQSNPSMVVLQDYNANLRQAFLDNGEHVTTPARRDRLNALSTLTHFLPREELYFLPCILPEVILCTKEPNERTRVTAFDLLIQMGTKMQAGGVIDSAKVSNMPDNTTTTDASLEEYVTMLSAGLAGSSPQMISATVTALSRVMFHFHNSISTSSILDLIQTMDLFLKSPSREIVRSVLGFVKVCIVTLPTSLMLPRLQTLIPSLMGWSHEYKAHFRVRIKNIVERMIRRFGFEAVEKFCPPEDQKLIAHVRKVRERRKRKKQDPTGNNQSSGVGFAAAHPEGSARKARFETEYDEAMSGSGIEDYSSSDTTAADSGLTAHFQQSSTKTGKHRHAQNYILENDNEPLDLLDQGALANVYSRKPTVAPKQRHEDRGKVNDDGKLLLMEAHDGENDLEMMNSADPLGSSAATETNLYIDALHGKDAPHRGQRGKLKFTNKRRNNGDELHEDVKHTKKRPIAESYRGKPGLEVRGAIPNGHIRRSASRPMGTKSRGNVDRRARRQISRRGGFGLNRTEGGRVIKKPFSKAGD